MVFLDAERKACAAVLLTRPSDILKSKSSVRSSTSVSIASSVSLYGHDPSVTWRTINVETSLLIFRRSSGTDADVTTTWYSLTFRFLNSRAQLAASTDRFDRSRLSKNTLRTTSNPNAERPTSVMPGGRTSCADVFSTGSVVSCIAELKY